MSSYPFPVLPRRRGVLLVLTGLCGLGLLAWAFSDYPSYLQQTHDCIKSLETRTRAQNKPDFDANADVRGILNGSLASYPGCDPSVLKISATMVSKAYDCAKMAVDLRNQFLKATGKAPVSGNVSNEISTAVIAEPGRLRSKFQFKPVNLDDPWQDPSVKGLQAGDLLYFKNENCTERSNLFLGHVMTVVAVHNTIFGNPKSVTVLEGHTNNHLPTYRTLTLDQIFKNGRGERTGGRNSRPAIEDISCCVFKGVTTFNDEPRARTPVLRPAGDAGDAPRAPGNSRPAQ